MTAAADPARAGADPARSAPGPERIRAAYLGPAGTYSHEALLAGAAAFASGGAHLETLPLPTIHDVVMAVQHGEADRGLVPIENSLEGSVNATLDALAFHAPGVQIVGETVLAIHHCLIGRAGMRLEQVEVVLSHPQALAQCAAFVRSRLPGATVRPDASTAEAVRAVAGSEEPWAALGPRSAAERYGGTVLVQDVEDVAGNETRFAWLAAAGVMRGGGSAGGGGAAGGAPERAGHLGERGVPFDAQERPWKTAVAFWPRESDHAGWLVDCLSEFSTRGVNLTRIESRPRKVGLGEYVFFLDVEGAARDAQVAAALTAIEGHVAQLRVLGSFPAA
ncbi:MAG TPA: prephenate dehydratase [Solirubrobacteraceae bacterium]|nr:prephenate dehydratase [Solirubrobacteraceae bacterium]